jgi:hypothetical protein
MDKPPTQKSKVDVKREILKLLVWSLIGVGIAKLLSILLDPAKTQQFIETAKALELFYTNHLRAVAEFLYFVGGVAVGIGTILVLRQVKLATTRVKLVKKDIELRINRAAKEKAVEYLIMYTEKYLPVIQEVNVSCRKDNLERFEGPTGKFSYKELSSE